MDLSHVRFQGEPVPPRFTGMQRTASPPARLARQVTRAVPDRIGALATLVLTSAGLDPAAYRSAPLVRRTPACLRLLRAESEAAACARLASHPELIPDVLSALLIGVTEFFRDPLVFRTLDACAFESEGNGPRAPRILSVGCSSGAELYSVAMLLAERGSLHRATMLGIDCRTDAVRHARAGVFANVTCPSAYAPLLRRYLEPSGPGGRVAPPIRQQIEWRTLDATRACPPGPWDVILCRNVNIYLNGPTSTAVIDRLTGQLAPGGCLVLGKAERPLTSGVLREVGRCVYRLGRPRAD